MPTEGKENTCINGLRLFNWHENLSKELGQSCSAIHCTTVPKPKKVKVKREEPNGLMRFRLGNMETQ